ncbi:hypothetical protein [Parasitella parasitica]|uniref:SMP-LTD domain-containing protein n=1 Tax=Parasitella parasitica TaxID=35722 RepID=A0A0B7NF95_9FUNG|nr:hypothetical protein [Parasitella parasitica]
MNFYISLCIAYIIGGITFIPTILLACYILSKPIGRTAINPAQQPSDTLEQQFHNHHLAEHSQFYKVGWLYVTRNAQATNKASSIGGIVKSYLSGSGGKTMTSSTTINEEYSSNNMSMTAENNSSFHYFAVLKFNTLYLYDSELQLDCKGIINVSNHHVQIYPDGLKDHELFSKSSRIQLKKKKSRIYQESQQQEYYLHCNRCVDKEDWFIALLRASKLELTSSQHGEPPKKDLQRSIENATQFDQDAMNHLISTIHSDPSHFELQWFNALLGRIFLGIYKTDRTKSFFNNKILKKIEKLNARRPPFLEEISLRSVDGGHAAPQITKPRFIHLSPQGEYTGDVQLFYDGHFRVELETVLKWKYSDRLPPIRIDLVLAITLKSIEGKMMIKIKEPPTNRAWMGFYKKPKMEWMIEPVVWEKRIGYSIVSKAIKTKIEEIFAETMVLPNMDDMVFFQTEDGAGGIFDKDDDDETVNNNKSLNSGVTNLSYHSLPELYSSPSDLVVTADPFPPLSTSVSSTATIPMKKRWFKRSSDLPTTATIHEQVTTADNRSEFIESESLSQQTLKSVITSNQHPYTKASKRKISKSQTKSANRQQLLAANVDHSIDSLSALQQLPSRQNLSPTLQATLSCAPQYLNVAHENKSALHSVRLSKKMLLLSEQRQPSSRLRSKSLPSTGLSEVNVVKKNIVDFTTR